MSNPHVIAWRRQTQRRRQVDGWGRDLGRLAGVVAAGAAGWMAKPVLFGWLTSPDLIPWGVGSTGYRLAMFASVAMAVITYALLIRGPDRDVLDPHPIDPGALVGYLLRRATAETWVIPAGLAAFSLPVAVEGSALAWVAISAVAAGGWLVGLLVGFPVNMAAIWAAESPALAGILAAIRGNTPQLQAALIYAPGAALVVALSALVASSQGATAALGGAPLGWLGLLVPPAVGALAWSATPGLARRYHHRATTMLAEIDALYASVESIEGAAEDDRSVYLEWSLRYLPAGIRTEVLKELRHGWRSIRGPVLGASWGAGFVSVAAGWSDAPEAAALTASVVALGLVGVGGVGVQLAATDPVWLDRALPVPPARRLTARAVALFGWAQGAILPGLGALWLRQGFPGGALLALEGLAICAALLGAGASRWRRRGWIAYVPAAVLVWAGFTSGVGGLLGLSG